MPAYERDHASHQRNTVQRASRSAAAPLPPILALQRAAGNATVSRMVEVQRERAEELHEHGAGCGHNQPVQRSEVEAVLRTPGTPVDPLIRAKAERAEGARLPDAVVHRGPEARHLTAALGARAFTTGNHIIIGEGGDNERTHLHEAKHLWQQARGRVSGTDNGGGLSVSKETASEEIDADSFSRRAETMSVPAQDAAQPAGGAQEATVAPARTTSVQRAPNIITVEGPDERRRRDSGYVRTSYATRDSVGGVPPRRIPDQNTVMGGSASDAMRVVGRHPGPGSDLSWLHAGAAWSHGDPVYGTPQRAGNLFAGTQQTNMAHLRAESWVPSRGVGMVGAPVTQMRLSGDRGQGVYDSGVYSVRSPYDPMNDRVHMPLNPRDTRPVGQRQELPPRREIHRRMDVAGAQWTMNAVPPGTVPEYDRWDAERRRGRDRSASPGRPIVYVVRRRD